MEIKLFWLAIKIIYDKIEMTSENTLCAARRAPGFSGDVQRRSQPQTIDNGEYAKRLSFRKTAGGAAKRRKQKLHSC
jgi:hypothetical protein